MFQQFTEVIQPQINAILKIIMGNYGNYYVTFNYLKQETHDTVSWNSVLLRTNFYKLKIHIKIFSSISSVQLIFLKMKHSDFLAFPTIFFELKMMMKEKKTIISLLIAPKGFR